MSGFCRRGKPIIEGKNSIFLYLVGSAYTGHNRRGQILCAWKKNIETKCGCMKINKFVLQSEKSQGLSLCSVCF